MELDTSSLHIYLENCVIDLLKRCVINYNIDRTCDHWKTAYSIVKSEILFKNYYTPIIDEHTMYLAIEAIVELENKVLEGIPSRLTTDNPNLIEKEKQIKEQILNIKKLLDSHYIKNPLDFEAEHYNMDNIPKDYEHG